MTNLICLFLSLSSAKVVCVLVPLKKMKRRNLSEKVRDFFPSAPKHTYTCCHHLSVIERNSLPVFATHFFSVENGWKHLSCLLYLRHCLQSWQTFHWSSQGSGHSLIFYGHFFHLCTTIIVTILSKTPLSACYRPKNQGWGRKGKNFSAKQQGLVQPILFARVAC